MERHESCPPSRIPMMPSKRSGRRLPFLCFALLLSLQALVGVSLAAAQATFQADKDDYYPGDIALLTGSGFSPGEEIAVRVGHADATPDSGVAHASWTVTADETGSFVTSWEVCGDDCLGSHLLATADGRSSGLHAEAACT